MRLTAHFNHKREKKMKEIKRLVEKYTTREEAIKSDNKIIGIRFFPSDRYRLYSELKNFQQWFTDQDAWYFGIWVNPEKFTILQYIEGDIYILILQDKEAYQNELKRLEDFYGPVPKAFTVIDCDAGTITDHYIERPS
jgi:hypothetical protein